MKLLASTKATQGAYESDFCWTLADELVMAGFTCDRDPEDDGPCGCRRSLVGIQTGRGTTTFIVVERADIRSVEDFAAKIFAARTSHANVEDMTDAEKLAAEMAEAAATFDCATVLELRDGVIQARVTEQSAVDAAKRILDA